MQAIKPHIAKNNYQWVVHKFICIVLLNIKKRMNSIKLNPVVLS